ncbi:MAG: PBSX family phage terminase large subunit [Janthinobacterium lividum]
MSETYLEIETPRAFAPLLVPSRYKGAHGGRGSGKSHFFGEMLVEKAILEPGLRAVCIREIQKSLEQSVKRLIEDKIAALGVGAQFEILDKEIRTPGDGLIIFMGMQSHTAESIKSLEGYDVAWVEEAQSLSKHSLRLLRPTMRKAGSELWFTWNPDSADDPVDQLLRSPDHVSDKIVVEANWSDNPWFPAELEQERTDDRRSNPDEYDHIWEGGYHTISEAVIFRHRVTEAEFETPPDSRFYFGADWGFAKDPSVLIRCFIDDDILYIDHEAFGAGVEMDDLPTLFRSIPGSEDWPIKADNSRPETISYMAKRHDFKITAADKWPGSVEDGVSRLKAFRGIRVHPRCPNIAKEFRMYSYKLDRLTGDILPVIVDDWNHGIDALRYALDGVIQNKRKPMVISEAALQRSRNGTVSRRIMR